MKLYRESMRRMSRVGLALLAVSVVMTAILCISAANGSARLHNLFTLLPTLPYFAFLGGLAFAYTGFSFLNKRSDSDFFHSLPVRRVELYLATSLSALTWTVATVVLSVLTSLCVYLFMASPFVPAYYPLGALYFIAATMLVFAAAAIACSITGTLFTNIILTGIVLLLPRFILFMLGRSIVANTSIIGYWDLSGIMNPCTNAATGMLVYTRRTFLYDNMFQIGNSLYSLALAAVELGIGGLLFTKRPSELAERGAVSARMQTLFACLLTLPVMLLSLRYTFEIRKLTIAILLVASLVIFIAYQLIVLRSGRRLIKTLPWYLCTALLAAGVFFGVRAASVSIRNYAPEASEIQSVQFGKPEPEYSEASYNTLLVNQIRFTEDGVKSIVAQSLKDAVSRLQQASAMGQTYVDRTFEPNATNTVVPIVIRLNNGRTVRRTIEFTDLNKLNEARNANAEFESAIRAFPPAKNACFSTGAQGNGDMTLDNIKLRESLDEEISAGGLIADSYYAIQPVREYRRIRYFYFNEGADQDIGNLMINGYSGARRFNQYYNIDLHMPKTAALWMQLSNQAGGSDSVQQAIALLDDVRASASDNRQMYLQLTFTNVPTQDGAKVQIGKSYNVYYYQGEQQGVDIASDYVDGILAILSRGTATSDPNTLFAAFTWDMYDQNAKSQQRSRSTTYLACAPSETANLLKLLGDWNNAEAEQERIYGNEVVAPELAPQA